MACISKAIAILSLIFAGSTSMAGGAPEDKDCEDLLALIMNELKTNGTFLDGQGLPLAFRLEDGPTVTGKHGGQLLEIPVKSEDDAKTTMSEILGTKASAFFGFEYHRQKDSMSVPNAAELNGAIEKLNQLAISRGVEPIPLRFFESNARFAKSKDFLEEVLKNDYWNVPLPGLQSENLHLIQKIVPTLLLPSMALKHSFDGFKLDFKFRTWLEQNFKNWRRQKGVSSKLSEAEEQLALHVHWNLGQGLAFENDLPKLKQFETSPFMDTIFAMIDSHRNFMTFATSSENRNSVNYDLTKLFDNSTTGALVLRNPPYPTMTVDDIYIIYRHAYFKYLQRTQKNFDFDYLSSLASDKESSKKVMIVTVLQRIEQIRRLAEELQGQP